MERKLLFVYNPKAGKAQVRNRLADILDIFAQEGYEITVAPTQKRDDARAVVAGRRKDYELIVCSGGDGTLDEVVTGMIQSGLRTPIGYIPAGSTNDFGGSISLPKNMVRAAQIAVRGSDFPCDIGTFRYDDVDDVFVYIAAFGLFTDVSYETGQEMKNVLGHMAYLLEGVKSLSSIRSFPMKVSWEGNEVEDDFIFGMVTNSLSVGGFKNITGRNVKLDDGLFECILVRLPQTPAQLQAVIRALLQMAPDENGLVVSLHTSHLHITCPEALPWTLDGEYGGAPRTAEIQNCRQALSIVYGE